MTEKVQKVTPIVIDGFEINAPHVTFQQLQEFSLVLYEKLLGHRKDRNYLLLERDKLRTVLENCRQEIKLARDKSLNMEEELERVQARHRQELKEVDQEVKYVLYNHNINLDELRSWEKYLMKKNEDQNFAEELELLQEKRQLKQELREQENRQEEELRQIKYKHEEEIFNLKKENDEVQIKYEIEFKSNLNKTTQFLNLKHEMEMSEIEERKNTHLSELKLIHKTRFDKMKNYFNSITEEHLALISHLKQSIDSMKKNRSEMSDQVKELQQESKKLKEPLTKSKENVKKLTRQLINYEKDLKSLKNNKRMLKLTMEETREAKNSGYMMLEKIKNHDNKDSLNHMDSPCFNSLIEFTVNTARKRRQLEELIEMLINDLRKKQQVIKDLSSDPDIRQALSDLSFEYWNPKKLNLELAAVCKAHNDLVNTLSEKLAEFCIPKQNLGFKLLENEYIRGNPAGLVSNQ